MLVLGNSNISEEVTLQFKEINKQSCDSLDCFTGLKSYFTSFAENKGEHYLRLANFRGCSHILRSSPKSVRNLSRNITKVFVRNF